MANFIKGVGDWTQYRSLQPGLEIDFHLESRRDTSYEEAMINIAERALKSLKTAQENGLLYLMFTHGHSTSRQGKITARSQIRKLMNSSLATPYIIRAECIQHNSVFVARIKKLCEIGKPGRPAKEKAAQDK